MSISVNVSMQLTVVETQAGLPNAATGKSSATFNALNLSVINQSASSSPPCVTPCSFTKTLVANGAQLDFTAIASSQTNDMTGKKLQYVILKTDSSNGHDLLINTGSSNGYKISGTNSFSQVLTPGMTVEIAGNNNTLAVDATHKLLDIAGVTGDVVHGIAVFG